MTYTFFGMQVALKIAARDPLRNQLYALIEADSEQRVGVRTKQTFWKRFAALLGEAGPTFEFGDWDLLRESNAQDTFDHWVTSIEGREAPDGAGPPPAPSSYIVVTMMVLVERGSNADQTLGEWCDLPQEEWLTRPTFAHLLAVFPRLNFANVQADAVYLIPGDPGAGLSDEDVRSPDFAHLKPLA